MKPLKILDIDKNTRVSLSYDLTPYAFEEVCGDMFGVQTLSIAKNYNLISSNDEVQDLVARVVDRIHYHNTNDYQEKRERIIGYWLAMNGYTFRFTTLRGYSQGEWADVVIYSKENESIDSAKESLENWFRGDIFNLNVEERKVFRSDDGEALDIWQFKDGVSAIMAATEEEIKDSIRENFNLVIA